MKKVNSSVQIYIKNAFIFFFENVAGIKFNFNTRTSIYNRYILHLRNFISKHDQFSTDSSGSMTAQNGPLRTENSKNSGNQFGIRQVIKQVGTPAPAHSLLLSQSVQNRKRKSEHPPTEQIEIDTKWKK